jgi:hypothetical protein
MRLETPCELRPNPAGSASPTFHPTPQRRRWKVIVIPLVLLALTAFPPCASADFIFSVSGSTSAGNPVAAEADFSIGPNGTITVVLKNLQTNMYTVGQAISGLTFSASGLINPPGLSLQSYSGTVIDVNSDGSITSLGKQTYSGSTGSNSLSAGSWSALSSNGITALTGGQPDHMILGPPNYGTNGNIVSKTGQFNPWFETSPTTGGVTFVLNAPGVTTDSIISNVVFTFGTSSGETQLAATPAPSSVILLASAAICIAGFMALSRRRRQAA